MQQQAVQGTILRRACRASTAAVVCLLPALRLGRILYVPPAGPAGLAFVWCGVWMTLHPSFCFDTFAGLGWSLEYPLFQYYHVNSDVPGIMS